MLRNSWPLSFMRRQTNMPPGAHRYWRLYITAASGGTDGLVAINELEMRNSPFSENLCSGGSASADSQYPSHLASEAFDANLYDITGASNPYVWASDTLGLPHWIQYDFGAGNEVEINSISIIARGRLLEQMPEDFEIQFSDDGVNWRTAWAETGVTWSKTYHFQRFTNPAYNLPSYSGSPHGAHTYWRWYSVGAVSDDAVALAELQFRASPGGADQATGGTASASTSWPGLPVTNAFDDNTGTLWSAGNNSWQAWVMYQFSTPVEVGEIAIIGRADGFTNTYPYRMIIQYSDDGVTWTTAWQPADQTGWSVGETRALSDPDYV